MSKITIQQAREAKHHISRLLEGRPEIAGVGIAPDPERGYDVKVNLSNPLPSDFYIQGSVSGVKVRTEVVGQVYSLA